MTLWLDGDSKVQLQTCDVCGADYALVKSFVLDETGPYAIGMTALHHHGTPEAWIDVIFGTFEEGNEDDRITFGCRVGPVENSPEPAATAVRAAVPYADSQTFGRKLSRDEALAHDRVADFWAVVDFLLVSEPTINHHVYGHQANRAPVRRGRWQRRST